MSDTGRPVGVDTVSEQVLAGLAMARGHLQQAHIKVQALQARTAAVASLLQTGGDHADAAVLIEDDDDSRAALAVTRTSLVQAELTCREGAAAAEGIGEHLTRAATFVHTASDVLEGYDPPPGTGGDDLPVDLAVLRTRVENLTGLLELAGPICQAVARNLRDAALVAGPSRTWPDGRHVGAVVEAGRRAHAAVGFVARASEASRHLESATWRTDRDGAASLGAAALVCANASTRLRAAQRHPPAPGGASSITPTGPIR